MLLIATTHDSNRFVQNMIVCIRICLLQCATNRQYFCITGFSNTVTTPAQQLQQLLTNLCRAPGTSTAGGHSPMPCVLVLFFHVCEMAVITPSGPAPVELLLQGDLVFWPPIETTAMGPSFSAIISLVAAVFSLSVLPSGIRRMSCKALRCFGCAASRLLCSTLLHVLLACLRSIQT